MTGRDLLRQLYAEAGLPKGRLTNRQFETRLRKYCKAHDVTKQSVEFQIWWAIQQIWPALRYGKNVARNTFPITGDR